MEDPLDIFKDLSEEIEEKPSLFKKIFIFSISILLLILVLSYFLTSPGIRNSFVGLIESSTIKDNIISINSTNKIIFEKNIYQELINYYDQNKEKEFKVWEYLKMEIILSMKCTNQKWYHKLIHRWSPNHALQIP